MRTRRSHLTVLFAHCAAVIAGLCLLTFSSSTALAQSDQKIETVADIKLMLTASLPTDARSISDVAAGAKVGDVVTIQGWVPQSHGAFQSETAEFTLTQPLKDEAAQAPTAQVRCVTSKGEPVKGTLKGKHGLKAGSEVFVTGLVESVSPGKVTIKAVSMHIPRSPFPANFFVSQTPEKVVDISEARKADTLKKGDEVVLRGRVGGSTSPFVAGRAIFTLVGRGLKACNENPDDHCKQPWDYCCDTRDEIRSNSVTVQVVDAGSQVLRTELKGREGIKELSDIIVIGKVASTDNKSVIINATSMHVVAR